VKLFVQRFSLSLLAMLTVSPAHAVIGKNVSEALESEHAQVCKIEILDTSDAGVDMDCTGTLISPTKVLTAGHCFGRDFSLKRFPVTVTCGGKATSAVKSVLLPNSADENVWLSNREPVRNQDFAVITLKTPVAHTPKAMVAAPNRYFDSEGNLLSGATCNVLGYGKSNSGMRGSLSQADLKDVKVSYDRDEKLLKFVPQGSMFLATSVDSGDSGGPVFCALKDHAPELMATIVLYRYVGVTMNRDLNLAKPISLSENSGTHLD
jgi:hypothetical protein